MVEHIVKDFFIKFCAKGHCGKRLCLSTGEHGCSMRSWQVVDFTPYWTDFGCLASVQADAFVQDATAYSLFFHIVVVAFYKGCLFVAFLFRKGIDIFLADGIETVLTPMLVGTAGLCYGVCLAVAFFVYVLAELLIVYFVAVFAFCDAYFLGKFHLHLAVVLYGVMCCLEGCEEVGFGYFVHFAFHHHDVIVGCAYHKFHVCALKLFVCWVDDKFTIDACHAYL